MAKRPAEESEDQEAPLKAGDRPAYTGNGAEAGPFEDEFEDEFESEDEILEAGVDGRPDEERVAEEKRGMWTTLRTLCDLFCLYYPFTSLIHRRYDGCGPEDFHTGA